MHMQVHVEYCTCTYIYVHVHVHGHVHYNINPTFLSLFFALSFSVEWGSVSVMVADSL